MERMFIHFVNGKHSITFGPVNRERVDNVVRSYGVRGWIVEGLCWESDHE